MSKAQCVFSMKRSLLVAVGTALLSFGMAVAAKAQVPAPEITYFDLPERGVKSAGFQVSVTCADLHLYGDVPTQIMVVADGASFPAERSITVRLSQSRRAQPPGSDCSYEIPLVLPEGQNKVSTTVYLPKWSIGGEFEVSVLENRRLIEGYRYRFSVPHLFPHVAEQKWWESAGQRFSWMIADAKDKPDASTCLVSLAPELMNVQELSSLPPGFEFANGWRQFRVVPVGELPTDWRGFDAVDVWIAEADTLRNLIKTQPASANAFRDYIRCGGTLWLLGTTADQVLADLFALPVVHSNEAEIQLQAAYLFGMQSIDYESARASGYQSTSNFRGYIREQLLTQSRFRIPSSSQSQLPNYDQIFTNNLLWIQNREQDGEKNTPPASDFQVHDVALGRVIVCRSSAAVPGSPQQWRTMAALSANDMSETLRRSVDPCLGDRRFWDWIIPDVAQPPVYPLIGLLIVFVIVVGPLAYRKFTKLGRGYLMMFVAPMLALLTTLAMFAYGLVADGLSTRGRVREVTWIGDNSGTAARYTRTTYFAGIRPTDGIHFPGNASVLHYQLPTVSTWYRAGEREPSTIGTIRLEDEQIKMDSGFLPSRQQKQFVTYRPVENVGGLKWEPSASLTSSLAIELRLGVIRDRDGQYYSFDKLPPGSTVAPAPIDKKDAGGLLSELYGIQRPLAPSAISSGRRVGDSLIDMVTQLENRPTRRVQVTRFSSGESAIETWLRMHLQIGSELPNGMFVAVADVTEDCIAVESTELVESVHYVVGALQ